MTSGIRSEFGVKLFGDDFDMLVKKANEIAAALGGVAGAADVTVEQVTGQPVLQITPDLAQLGKYGLTVDEALDYVQAIAGRPVGDVIEGQLRFPLAVRLPETHRASPSALAQLPVVAAGGEQIPLGRLAKIETIESPSTITREWGRRRIAITCNIRGRDLGSFVAEARAKIGAEISLPDERYRIEYGGQYEHLERAKARLWIVTPIALALVLALLYVTYEGWLDSLRVFTAVPFAWVGGIIALWLRDMPFSVPAAVGFIAMSGLAVLDDMILVSTIRRLRAGGLGVDEAVATAARQRLRPVLMTTLVASLGFLPMAASTGVGAEVQRPLATVVIGGAAAAMITSLLVVRVLYVLSERLRFNSRGPKVGPASSREGSSYEV